MTDSFVGFAQSPKPDPNRKVETLSFEFDSSAEIKLAIQLLSTEAGLSSWLGKLAKFDFRQGAKLRYSDELHGATFALIQIPKRFVVIAETLGEVDIRIREKKQGYQLSLSIKKALLPEEREQWADDVAAIAKVFEAVANG
jgi:hypothetical protein